MSRFGGGFQSDAVPGPPVGVGIDAYTVAYNFLCSLNQWICPVYAAGMLPRTAGQIRIRQTRTSTIARQEGEVSEASLSLAEKMDEFVFRLGCSSAHTLGVVVQLLTVGKVRLDFREYNERLQLEEASDVLTRPEAMHLTESYLAAMRQGVTDPAEGLDVTQKIIIQAPKRTVL